jgi:lipocalin
VGSLEKENGRNVVQDDFELICWDIVTSPSTPGSWIYSEEPSREQQMSESTKNKNSDNLKNGLTNFLMD